MSLQVVSKTTRTFNHAKFPNPQKVTECQGIIKDFFYVCMSLHVLSQSDDENCYHFFKVDERGTGFTSPGSSCTTIISFDSVIFTFLHEAFL